MKVNGEQMSLSEEKTVGRFLEEEGYNRLRVAVERNGEIVPKSQYDQIFLSEADELEIVSFVGGG